MRIGLQTQYTLSIITIILLIVLIMTGANLLQLQHSIDSLTETSEHNLADDLFEQLQKKGNMLTSFLADSLFNPLYSYDTEAIYQLLTVALNQEDVEYVIVYDQHGKIVHDGYEHIPSFGQPLQDSISKQALLDQKPISHINENILELAMPISTSDLVLGGVKVGISLTGIRSDMADINHQFNTIVDKGRREYLWLIFGSTTLLIVMGFIMAALLSRQLTKPIRQLKHYANEIGQGHYDVDVSIKRRDEIGDLAHEFREMGQSLRKSTAEIHEIAYHDSLTHLPNRFSFRQQLEQTLEQARRSGELFAVLFIDLDDFKRINDTLGHSTGDELLKRFSQRLLACTRPEDLIANCLQAGQATIARLGGDEFTMLLRNLRTAQDAGQVAKRIIDAITEPFQLGSHEVVIGTSIGITLFPKDATNAEQLLKNADIAMYQAKAQGKNNYQFFRKAMNASALERLELEKELRNAISSNQLCLYYQPLIDTQTGQLTGTEALIRWQHPRKGLIPPAQFIPMAEETGLISAIGEWVLKRACADTKRWQMETGRQFHVAVNISGAQIHKQNIVQVVHSVLTETGLSPGSLHVELTETCLLQSEEAAERALRGLKALGVEVWMDDFGTGYSSLSYLKRFPVNGVKVDKSFVGDIDTDPDDKALTFAIISMAHRLKLSVVAEGVENAQQFNLLKHARCQIAQGYWIARPMPFSELRRWAATRPSVSAFG